MSDDLEQQLLDFLDTLDAEARLDREGEVPPDQWRIDGDERANISLRRLAHVEAERKRVQDFAMREATKLQQWLDNRMAPLERQREYLESSLTGYLRAVRDAYDGPIERAPKSLNLPAGQVTSTAGRERVVLTDEPGFVDWASVHAIDWLTVNPKPRLVEMAKAKDRKVLDDGDRPTNVFGEPIEGTRFARLVRDGEVVPGVVVIEPTEAERSYKAKPRTDVDD